LKDAEPQSHRAQEKIRVRLVFLSTRPPPVAT